MKHRALTLAPSEAEAIERAKQGDAEAFALLYGLHKRRVYSLCLRMTANSAKAEDLTQETFLQLFRKIGTFRGDSAFSTWLHRMAVNVVLMQLRKKSLPVARWKRRWKAMKRHRRRNWVRKTRSYRAPLTGCDCSGQWRRCRLDIEGFLYCMTWKDMSITRSRPWWDVPSATASRSYTRRA